MEASPKKKKAQRNLVSDLQNGRFERAPCLQLFEGLSWCKREWFEGRNAHCLALGLGLGLDLMTLPRPGLDLVTSKALLALCLCQALRAEEELEGEGD